MIPNTFVTFDTVPGMLLLSYKNVNNFFRLTNGFGNLREMSGKTDKDRNFKKKVSDDDR